jgi:hypothetical protein
MKRILERRATGVIHGLILAGLLGTLPYAAQAGRGRGNTEPPTLGLTNGFIDLDTPDFKLQLVKDSQTIAALKPKAATNDFDFTPNDQLKVRQGDHFFHLGDLTLRLRQGDSAGEWKSYSTAAARKPVKALKASGKTLAAADLSATLPEDCPLQVTRSWVLDGGKLAVKFELKNKSDKPVEIGSLGIPLIFNNYLTGRTRPQVHEKCAFSDPAINMDGGYVQVTRLIGKGPALVVVPEGKTPLEAYNPILDRQNSPELQVFRDATPLSQTFEGFYEWMAHSKAYGDNEWKDAQPWNTPTSEILAPGASRTFGLKFLVAPEIRDIEKTLAANARPVAVGVPGFITPMDVEARLFLNYGKAVKSLESEPKGAIAITEDKSPARGWKAYTLRGKTWGRAQLKVTYQDGLVQTISYYVTKPAAEAVADLGNFLFTKDWYTDTNDPFHRAPSIMNYDHEHDRVVLQDPLAWKAGLQDEGGSGGWVSAAMKLYGQPTPDEVKKFEEFVDGVLWGGIQYKEDSTNRNGPKKYTVVNSMFYYDHELTNFDYAIQNWDTNDWTKWNKQRALTGGRDRPRAYNYPHVVAAYWSMYHIARNNPGLFTNHPWDWYLDQAYQTVHSLTHGPVGYLNVGLMEGDVFLFLLQDLKREGWKEKADDIEQSMKRRVDGGRTAWANDPYPFGSEMAWDSTGQEEVFAWARYFGYTNTAQLCLNSILGYMPSIPNWGYDGNARRYWDFYFGAGPGGHQERQIHHYGSGINAVPLLTDYRDKPDDLYLLRLGYAGNMGALSAIQKDGFPSAAFHSWPSLMRWDTYIGDYGPNMYCHAVDAATYVVKHPDFGWLAFGGNIKGDAKKVTVTPLDAFRQRVYLAPAGLWLTLDAGKFESVEYDPATHAVRVQLAKAGEFTPQALLRVEQPAKLKGIGTYQPGGALKTERDGFVVPLGSSATWVELTAK